MESIAGRPVDMKETNTILVPAYPGTTDRNLMYSTDGYTQSQLDEGLARFDKKFDDAESRSFILADVNNYLFDKKLTRASLQHLRRKGYKVVAIFWGYEAVLLLEPGTKKTVLLQNPFCGAGEARKGPPLERAILRGMTIQLATLAMVWCQERQGTVSEMSRGQMNSSFHDAVFPDMDMNSHSPPCTVIPFKPHWCGAI